MTPHRLVARLAGLLAVAVLMTSPPAEAFKDGAHGRITQAAFASSAILQAIRDLGVEPTTALTGSRGDRPPLQWLLKGARDEDAWFSSGFMRFRNHFFDPLSGQGLNVPGVPRGVAAPDWALEDRAEIDAQQYSYADARKALLAP